MLMITNNFQQPVAYCFGGQSHETKKRPDQLLAVCLMSMWTRCSVSNICMNSSVLANVAKMIIQRHCISFCCHWAYISHLSDSRSYGCTFAHWCLHSRRAVAPSSANCPPEITASQRGLSSSRGRKVTTFHTYGKFEEKSGRAVHFDGESIRASSGNTNWFSSYVWHEAQLCYTLLDYRSAKIITTLLRILL